MSLVTKVLETPLGYAIWQRPFADAKFAPVKAHNNLERVRRVLDVGCGPGTNTNAFQHVDYLGIDWNASYITAARRRYRRSFITADVTTYQVDEEQKFDFIILNSLLHHIDEQGCQKLLAHLNTLLTPDGHVHILDLVLPLERGVARQLALWDRGDFPRPLTAWRDMFESVFQTMVFEPYVIGIGKLPLWNMVYFKGAPRSL